MPSVKGRFGSGIRIQRAPGSGLECAAEPTLAVVALLHLKRTAAIGAVEGHLIERVNGGLGPEVAFGSLSSNDGFVRTAAVRPDTDERQDRVKTGRSLPCQIRSAIGR